jgi:hypothetical protein
MRPAGATWGEMYADGPSAAPRWGTDDSAAARTHDTNVLVQEKIMTTVSPARAAARPAHGLAAPDKFFAAIRPLFGTMTSAQVEGIEAKLAAFAAAASPIAYVALWTGDLVSRNRPQDAAGPRDRPRSR